MGRRVASFPDQPAAAGSRKYPWSDWTDGNAWEIRRGEDYDVATENMRVNLHMKAKHLGCKVRTRKTAVDGGEGLVFQFLIPEEEKQMAPIDGFARDAALESLYADCCYIYEAARREVSIPRRDGTRQMYAPIRFKQQMERAHADGALLAAVARVVERRTQGFGHLEAAKRADLMLETFILDETKPYHALFSPRTLKAARDRMDEYYRRHPDEDE